MYFDNKSFLTSFVNQTARSPASLWDSACTIFPLMAASNSRRDFARKARNVMSCALGESNRAPSPSRCKRSQATLQAVLLSSQWISCWVASSPCHLGCPTLTPSDCSLQRPRASFWSPFSIPSAAAHVRSQWCTAREHGVLNAGCVTVGATIR